MTVIHLYPPIALATIVAAFWSLALHRVYRRDLANGVSSLSQIALLGTPLLGVVGYLWWRGLKSPLKTHLDFLVAAFVGMGFGAVTVWLILWTFSKKHPLGHFIYCLVGLGIFTFMLTAGFFIDLK